MKQSLKRFFPKLRKRTNVIYRFSGNMPYPPNLPPGLYWEPASEALLDLVMSDDHSRCEALKGLLAQGAQGIIIHDGERWAAHGFISPPGISLPHHIPKRIVSEPWWLFYMHTSKEWRRRGLQKACIKLKLRFINQLAGRIDMVMTDTGEDNMPSRKGFITTGFVPAGVVRSLELHVPKHGIVLLHAKWNRTELHKELVK